VAPAEQWFSENPFDWIKLKFIKGTHKKKRGGEP